jgi:hypothetical protein
MIDFIVFIIGYGFVISLIGALKYTRAHSQDFKTEDKDE